MPPLKPNPKSFEGLRYLLESVAEDTRKNSEVISKMAVEVEKIEEIKKQAELTGATIAEVRDKVMGVEHDVEMLLSDVRPPASKTLSTRFDLLEQDVKGLKDHELVRKTTGLRLLVAVVAAFCTGVIAPLIMWFMINKIMK